MSQNSKEHRLIEDAIESVRINGTPSLADYIRKHISGKRVILYGAGAFGNELLEYLSEYSIVPDAFIDSNKHGNKNGIRILHPLEYEHKSAIVIISIVLSISARQDVIRFLSECGYSVIMDGQVIRSHYVSTDFEPTYENYQLNYNDIINPLSYLSDEESRIIYSYNIAAHITKDYSYAKETDGFVQYFFSAKLCNGSPITFVDCGAYNGDTFKLLMAKGVNLKHYIAFEPILSNYNQLIKAACDSNVPSTLLPIAVSDLTGFNKFKSNLGSSSRSSIGDTDVLYGIPDSIIINHEIDFIKMDIEGDEPNTLRGCLQTIKRCKPELAISVYHKINHFWEIPNWISSLGLGYKLYMRTHSSACMETVLYAVHEE